MQWAEAPVPVAEGTAVREGYEVVVAAVVVRGWGGGEPVLSRLEGKRARGCGRPGGGPQTLATDCGET